MLKGHQGSSWTLKNNLSSPQRAPPSINLHSSPESPDLHVGHPDTHCWSTCFWRTSANFSNPPSPQIKKTKRWFINLIQQFYESRELSERWNPAALVMTTTVLMKSLLKTSPATPLPPPPAWPRPFEGGEGASLVGILKIIWERATDWGGALGLEEKNSDVRRWH